MVVMFGFSSTQDARKWKLTDNDRLEKASKYSWLLDWNLGKGHPVKVIILLDCPIDLLMFDFIFQQSYHFPPPPPPKKKHKQKPVLF